LGRRDSQPPTGISCSTEATYEELTEVPHLDYLVEQRDAGVSALGFVFVRHMLIDRTVDVAGLERTRLA